MEKALTDQIALCEKSSIAFIGFKSSGKSTLGCLLSQALKRRFVDTDKLIEAQHFPLTCREVYRSFGEERFREMERGAIASLVFEESLVLATGGGSLIMPACAKILKEHCWLIYLKTSLAVLQKRILAQDSLPGFISHSLLQSEQAIANLFSLRSPLYEAYADEVIEMDSLSLEDCLEKICRRFKF